MKFKNIKIFSWIALGTMLTVTSCRDDTFADYWDDSDEITVNISVGLEDMTVSSRADETGNNDIIRKIGDGSKIDMLVYAVYYDAAPNRNIPNHEPDWQAATEYVKNYENDDERPFHGVVMPGYGQTILDVSKTIQNGAPQPITLTLKKGYDYRVVFWAQNHETEAFVIDDLKRVQMKYKVLHENTSNGTAVDDIHSINNDEARDAFCRSLDLSGDQSNRNVTIYLRRPLAQINVGTRGFDFESITRNTPDGEEYLYSKIRINRAARYLNVVTDEIYTTTTESDQSASSTEAFYTIDYEYSKIPAYWQMDFPPYPSYTVHDLDDEVNGAYNAFVSSHPDFFNSTDEESMKKEFREAYEKEEFLKVHLFEHNDDETAEYNSYHGMGASMDIPEDEQDRSEVFKYLSMCYVLTNSTDEYQDVLTNVKVWMAKDSTGKDEVEIANITQVPVQRNHRTNIVGSLLTAHAKINVVVDQDFAGRKVYSDNDDLVSGEITEGFYYDAKNKEFQISSVNGLLFFQQLVNGNLTVRQISNNLSASLAKDGLTTNVRVGSNYPYYDKNGNEWSLKYKAWEYGKSIITENVANIIVKGSKYDELYNNGKGKTVNGWTFTVSSNNGGKWPANNNFPFYGATVKLMTDIDLAGVEWIPIGFDCANWDATIGIWSDGWTKDSSGSYSYHSNNPDKIINYTSLTSSDGKNTIPLGDRRAFCGTFDGNGHTIYNLTTKKFGPNVHESAWQDYGASLNSNQHGPYDAVQWFARGFFGVVGPGAVIKDLRLQNVEVQGNNAVGAIVGQVSSVGFPAKITGCVVDGGSIDVIPLYRGDKNVSNMYGRTTARGCYIGGIVGQFVAKDASTSDKAEICGNEVRNLTMIGYRRMGGIVGAIADQGSAKMGNENIQLDIKVERNSFLNSTIIVNQYRAFNFYWNYLGNDPNIWMNGFGWGSGSDYVPMTDNFVGGYYGDNEASSLTDKTNFDVFINGKYSKGSYKSKNGYYDYVNSNNSVSNLQYCELTGTPDNTNTKDDRRATTRLSTIKNVPLIYIPPFTSLFIDKVSLENNYYGDTDIHTKVLMQNENNGGVQIWNRYGNRKFHLPVNFPNGVDIVYDETKPLTGMYVESVEIDGSAAPGGRSVITPIGVDGTNACVMYITARDLKQFVIDMDEIKSDGYTIPRKNDLEPKLLYKQPSAVKNVVLRGSPYAWAGIIIAPNENMKSVSLEHVTIYDVYKTIAREEEAPAGTKDYEVVQNWTKWVDGDTISLNVTDCNLRGYTVPGKGWKSVNYKGTTFEQGSETKFSYESMGTENANEYKTCKVEAPTVFDSCFFKAPFYIDLSEARDKGYQVSFINCNGTSAYPNKTISGRTDAYYIGIDKDIQNGQTVVTYYDNNKQPIK